MAPELQCTSCANKIEADMWSCICAIDSTGLSDMQMDAYGMVHPERWPSRQTLCLRHTQCRTARRGGYLKYPNMGAWAAAGLQHALSAV